MKTSQTTYSSPDSASSHRDKVSEPPRKSGKPLGMNVPMYEDLMERLSKAALASNITKAAYVRKALEESLKKDGF